MGERADAERAAPREDLGVFLKRHLEQAEERSHLPLLRCACGGAGRLLDLARRRGNAEKGGRRARGGASAGRRDDAPASRRASHGLSSAPFSGLKKASISLRSAERSCCFIVVAPAPTFPAPFDASALSSRSRSLRSLSRLDAPARAPPGAPSPTVMSGAGVPACRLHDTVLNPARQLKQFAADLNAGARKDVRPTDPSMSQLPVPDKTTARVVLVVYIIYAPILARALTPPPPRARPNPRPRPRRRPRPPRRRSDR